MCDCPIVVVTAHMAYGAGSEQEQPEAVVEVDERAVVADMVVAAGSKESSSSSARDNGPSATASHSVDSETIRPCSTVVVITLRGRLSRMHRY